MLRKTEGASTLKLDAEGYGKLVEVFTAALYASVLRPGDTAVDGGVCGGMHLIPMSRLVGARGAVYGFEANPVLLLDIEGRIAKEGADAARLFGKALGDAQGQMRFLARQDNIGLSQLVAETTHVPEDRELGRLIEVDVVRLDSIVPSPVAFIKLDLEGADFLGIKGAEALLRQGKPILIFENSRAYAAEQYGYTMEAFLAFFEDIGYLVVDIHGRVLTPATWHDDTMSWEFIAIAKSDERIRDLFVFINRFWTQAAGLPVIEKWHQCPEIGVALAAGHGQEDPAAPQKPTASTETAPPQRWWRRGG